MHRGLAVVGMVVMVGACAAPAPPTTSPVAIGTPSPAAPGPTSVATATTSQTDTPTPTTESTPEPTLDVAATQQPDRGTWAQRPPSPLLMNAAVRVLVPELNLRERPWLGAKVIHLAKADDILIVSDASPFENDGYIWYHGFVVSATGKLPPLPQGFFFGVGEPISGWFAATKDSTPYVARFEPRCPDTVDLENVAAMLPAERLACFGDRSIELDGYFFCAGCDNKQPGRYAPFWLASHGVDRIWQVGVDSPLGLGLRFRPSGVDRPDPESIIRVRGHFRDDAAERCSIATFYPWYSMYDEPAVHDLATSVARQLCRQEFVVESYRVIGTGT